ncbi:MAG: tetratricopeptide repeat protein [Nodosilinea sp. LVE1205-7]|jgi:Flp pilus assembly protein TadD
MIQVLQLKPLSLVALLLGSQPQLPLTFTPLMLTTVTLENLAYPPFLIQAQTADRYRQQGLDARQRGDLGRAVATLKIAVALDPHNPTGYTILGWTQHLAGDRVEAITTLQQALDQTPDFVPALNALGIVYLVEGDLTAAIRNHNRAVSLEADNEIAHYNLALAHQRLGQGDWAIAHGQAATRLEPGNPHPWLALALAYRSVGDLNQARSAYRQALTLDRRYGQPTYLNHLDRAGFSPDQTAAIAILAKASL